MRKCYVLNRHASPVFRDLCGQVKPAEILSDTTTSRSTCPDEDDRQFSR